MRPGQVISFIQEKGGSGKSTMLRMLASILLQEKLSVAILDLDHQKSAYKWAKKSYEKHGLDLSFAHIPVAEQETIGPRIKSLKKEFDIVLVDTAGIESQASFFVVLNSDLVLMPTKANDDDIAGMLKTYNKVKQVSEESTKPIKAYSVLFDIDEGTNITKRIVDALRAHNIPCLTKRVAHRTTIKEFTTNGGFPTGTALKETKELLASLQTEGLLHYYNDRFKVTA